MPVFLRPDIPIAIPEWQPAAVAGAEATARLWAATTLLVLSVVAIGAVLVAASIMYRHLERGALGIVIAAIVAAVAIVALEISGPSPLYRDLGEGVFAKTIGSYPKAGIGLEAVDIMIRWANLFGTAAAAFLAVAVSALVPGPVPDLSGKTLVEAREAIDAAVRKLATKVRDMKYLLLSAAFVLFAAIVHMKAWRDWPLAFFPEKDAGGRKAYEALAGATVTYDAFHFVLILAAIFLPVAYWLRGAGHAIAALDPTIGRDSAAQERWLSANGIALPVGEQVQRVIAIVSPFLGAPALDLLKKLASIAAGG
jgi:hypothetical protein